MVSILIETFSFLDTMPAYMISFGLFLTTQLTLLYQVILLFIWGCWLNCPPVDAGRKKKQLKFFLVASLTCVVSVSHLSYGLVYGELCCTYIQPSESDVIGHDRYERS